MTPEDATQWKNSHFPHPSPPGCSPSYGKNRFLALCGRKKGRWEQCLQEEGGFPTDFGCAQPKKNTSPKGIAATLQPGYSKDVILRVWGCWRLGQEPYLPAETNFLGEKEFFIFFQHLLPRLWALGGSSTQAARGLHCSSPLLTLFWGLLHAKGFCSYHPYRAVTIGVGSDPQILGCLGKQLWQCILWPSFGLGW